MLNELFELAASLEEVGIKQPSWHSRYVKCPNRPTFLVLLSKEGAVAAVEPMAREQVSELRKYEIRNTGRSFPIFNVFPLLHAKSDEAKKTLYDFRRLLKDPNSSVDTLELLLASLRAGADVPWTGNKLRLIGTCLQSAGLKDQLGAVDHRGLGALFERSSNLSATQLWEGIWGFLVRGVHTLSRDVFMQMLPLLITGKQPSNLSLCLDLEDRSSFDYPINHPKTQEWVNERLQNRAKEQQASGSTSFPPDAFGFPLDTWGKFPGVKVPLIGRPVIPRSMNEENKCQFRYGRICSGSFPAGSVVQQRLKDGFEWLIKPKHKGLTWDRALHGTDVLLFAYANKLVSIPPPLAAILGGEDAEKTRFEKATEQIFKALSGIVVEHPQSKIRVFALAMVDTARSKILFNHSYDAETILETAPIWQRGCRNIPEISFLGCCSGLKAIPPIIPLPAHVVECVNTTWLCGGSKARAVHGLKFAEGINLFMDAGVGLVKKALHLVLRNTAPLLLALGHHSNRRDALFRTDKNDFVWHAERLPAILGLLLFRLNIKRSDYMYSAPFLVGRLLSLSDILHKEYCKHVRKNELPPQLLGNSLIGICLENPVEGLARLSERLPLYIGWADTGKGADMGLAKWGLGQIAQVSDQLASESLPQYASDAERAQILLGYIAGHGKKEEKN